MMSVWLSVGSFQVCFCCETLQISQWNTPNISMTPCCSLAWKAHELGTSKLQGVQPVIFPSWMSEYTKHPYSFGIIGYYIFSLLQRATLQGLGLGLDFTSLLQFFFFSLVSFLFKGLKFACFRIIPSSQSNAFMPLWSCLLSGVCCWARGHGLRSLHSRGQGGPGAGSAPEDFWPAWGGGERAGYAERLLPLWPAGWGGEPWRLSTATWWIRVIWLGHIVMRYIFKK